MEYRSMIHSTDCVLYASAVLAVPGAVAVRQVFQPTEAKFTHWIP